MGKVLGGAYGASCGLVIEPKRTKLCRTCRKHPSAPGDPFCSTECCKDFYGCSTDRPERYPARETVRKGDLLCLRCKEWFPDESFNKHKGRPKRRCRAGWCRECKRVDNRRRSIDRGAPGFCGTCGGETVTGSSCRTCAARVAALRH